MCDIENNKERDDLVCGLLPQLLMNDGAKQPHGTLASFELLNLGESSELSIYLPRFQLLYVHEAGLCEQSLYFGQ